MTSLFYLDWTRSAHDASLFSNRSIKRERELKFRSDKMKFHECIHEYWSKNFSPRAPMEKNNSMNVVVYQSRYHAYRSFQWIENNNASITECKTSRCLWSVHRFSNVWQFEKLPRNWLLRKARYICANCTSCHAIKGGEKSRDIIGPHKGNRNKWR